MSQSSEWHNVVCFSFQFVVLVLISYSWKLIMFDKKAKMLCKTYSFSNWSRFIRPKSFLYSRSCFYPYSMKQKCLSVGQFGVYTWYRCCSDVFRQKFKEVSRGLFVYSWVWSITTIAITKCFFVFFFDFQSSTTIWRCSDYHYGLDLFNKV